MTTLADFMPGIIATPDDDVPRLVLADWLEDQGDPLADFIRVSIEVAKLPPPLPVLYATSPREVENERWIHTGGFLVESKIWEAHSREVPLQGERYRIECAHEGGQLTFPCVIVHRVSNQLFQSGVQIRFQSLLEDDNGEVLRQRERDLFAQLGANPFRWTEKSICTLCLPGMIRADVCARHDGFPPTGVIRRGFVEEVLIRCDAWMVEGPYAAACQPLQMVRLVDKEPAEFSLHSPENWMWQFFEGDTLRPTFRVPLPLFNALPKVGGNYSGHNAAGGEPNNARNLYYQSRSEAQASLSAAAIFWARAKTPPLGIERRSLQERTDAQ